MITYFKDKNNKSKKKYKRITTIIKSIDTFVIIATTFFTRKRGVELEEVNDGNK